MEKLSTELKGVKLRLGQSSGELNMYVINFFFIKFNIKLEWLASFRPRSARSWITSWIFERRLDLFTISIIAQISLGEVQWTRVFFIIIFDYVPVRFEFYMVKLTWEIIIKLNYNSIYRFFNYFFDILK